MFMITPSPSTSEYKAEFPALTTFENPQQKTKHSWKIQSSNVVGPTDATSRAEAQDQAQGRNVFTNTDSKQQFTFDNIPPSKWCERSVEMLSWCAAELQYYNIDMVFLDDEVWPEEDPQTEEWSEAIKDYYNDGFTKGSLYDEIFEIDTKEIRVFSDISKDGPLHQYILAESKSN
ncbi:hypothetical protein L1987_44249 [Smallanthus sonchifolius]|uniref:Uncharacterized protein n=1 Tax=Smallanthus sonchifolius TaxID=185202 RepID=A0ACB9GPK7_9ASTR|nr:hypothetical protein L1987_44249 [Smallanthus sonchifolius]